jgi:hypothetical protein
MQGPSSPRLSNKQLLLARSPCGVRFAGSIVAHSRTAER